MRNLQYFCLVTAILVVFLCSCSVKKAGSLRPGNLQQRQTITLTAGDLTAVFVDNTAYGAVHLAGYNGLASLRHNHADSTIFVPRYAGINLEHIFGGDSLLQLFEPRRHPMTLFKKNESSVVLYQGPTPLSGVESITEFTLVAPHYIDMKFTCLLHNEKFFNHDYAGFFWASYIDRPQDKKIYFIGEKETQNSPGWVGTYSEEHGVKSTHRGMDDQLNLFFADNFNASLPKNYSDYRFAAPFYFGHFHKMAFAFLFEDDKVIRFSQSPTGGGPDSPAWDFQFIIQQPKMGKIYGFKSRAVYKPFITQDEIREEYKRWKQK